MIRSRTLAAAAVALTLPAFLTACGDDEADTTTTTEADGGDSGSSGSSGTDATETTDAPDDGEGAMDGAKSFEMTTADGSFSVSGTADSCDNPTESTLKVTFSDGTTEVEVDATNGSGSVVAAGEFEGTVESVSVGDAGDVTVSGRGSIADPGASPTTFEITGSCA